MSIYRKAPPMFTWWVTYETLVFDKEVRQTIFVRSCDKWDAVQKAKDRIESQGFKILKFIGVSNGTSD